MKKILWSSIVTVGVLISGCGGGSGGNSSTTSVAGTAVDGYLKGANVCLDLNNNNICDTAEPSATTKSDGTFVINTILPQKDFNIIVSGGIDSDTGKSFNGILYAPYEANVSKIYVTPISTMVSKLTKEGVSIDEAKKKTAAFFGISKDKLNSDPKKDKAVQKSALLLEKSLEIVAKSKKELDKFYGQIAKHLKENNIENEKMSDILDGTPVFIGKNAVDDVERILDNGDDLNGQLESIGKLKDEGVTSALQAQTGVKSYLFYGEVNHASLGRIKNVRIFDANDVNNTLSSDDNVSNGYPVVTTVLKDFNVNDSSYQDFYINKLAYSTDDGKLYVVDMKKDDNNPTPKLLGSNLTGISFKKINYLGTRAYVTAKNDQNDTVMIDIDSEKKENIGDKSILSVAFSSWGEAANGYIMYDNTNKMIQKCSLKMDCTNIIATSKSRNFKGDLLGTKYALVIGNDGVYYKIDKTNGAKTALDLQGRKIASGYGTTSINGDTFYFVSDDHNLYGLNVASGDLKKITPSADDTLERIRSFTDHYVIYGSDTILKAAKKDGSSTEAKLLIQTDMTKGYKYVTNYGMSDKFLYVTYNLDINPDTNTYTKTSYKACYLDDATGETQCRDNSFWAAVVAKKSGIVDYSSKYPYAPYAFVRVDDTDDYAGGALKAVDPSKPLDDGLYLGTASKYNFQTFLTNYRYYTDIVDSDGGVVIYAKNDVNFHVDAFFVDLLKKDSLVQLTNTEPYPEVIHGRDHCHGRVCMLCHNLAGGKIYKDLKGSKTAYGYRIKLLYKDGNSTLAKVAKGKGENFSIELNQIKGDFKAEVLDANGTVVNKSAGYYHQGVNYANCNYCHGRYGKTKYDAPGGIYIGSGE